MLHFKYIYVYIFHIYTCQDYMLKQSIDLMKENSFKLAKLKKRRYSAQTIMDIDYTDNIALLPNTPSQAKCMLHSLEQTEVSIGLYVNADKTEYICLNQRGNIVTLISGPLKLVEKFPYLRSSISSTENDINMRLTKAWTAVSRSSVIWKSDLTDKIKRSFFQAVTMLILQYGCTTWTLTKCMEKKLDSKL